MNASKENALLARAAFVRIVDLLPWPPAPADVELVKEFFQAATRKLPSEESYARERARKDEGSWGKAPDPAQPVHKDGMPDMKDWPLEDRGHKPGREDKQ